MSLGPFLAMMTQVHTNSQRKRNHTTLLWLLTVGNVLTYIKKSMYVCKYARTNCKMNLLFAFLGPYDFREHGITDGIAELAD